MGVITCAPYVEVGPNILAIAIAIVGLGSVIYQNYRTTHLIAKIVSPEALGRANGSNGHNPGANSPNGSNKG